jgi:hypothetical protein
LALPVLAFALPTGRIEPFMFPDMLPVPVAPVFAAEFMLPVPVLVFMVDGVMVVVVVLVFMALLLAFVFVLALLAVSPPQADMTPATTVKASTVRVRRINSPPLPFRIRFNLSRGFERRRLIRARQSIPTRFWFTAILRAPDLAALKFGNLSAEIHDFSVEVKRQSHNHPRARLAATRSRPNLSALIFRPNRRREGAFIVRPTGQSRAATGVLNLDGGA